jgi:hypothetical protein
MKVEFPETFTMGEFWRDDELVYSDGWDCPYCKREPICTITLMGTHRTHSSSEIGEWQEWDEIVVCAAGHAFKRANCT